MYLEMEKYMKRYIYYSITSLFFSRQKFYNVNLYIMQYIYKQS